MTPSPHLAKHLWQRQHPATGYPPGVVAVPEPIAGLAFFPGGYGLWECANAQPLPPFPVGGIMVLGHDFHSRDGYEKSRKAGGEPLTMPTWANLLALFREVGIAPQRCFFTNLYMGLRAGSVATGVFPGASDATFVAHCEAFLLEQLRAQRPSLVLTLGVHVPYAVGRMSPELAAWGSDRGLKHLDRVGAVRTGVTFSGIDAYCTTVVALIHPSLRRPSLRHRQYREATGAGAELAMLRDGIAISGVVAADEH